MSHHHKANCIFLDLFIYFIPTYVYVSSLMLSSENICITRPLLMGYLMRLEVTRVRSLNGFQLVMFFLWRSLISFS